MDSSEERKAIVITDVNGMAKLKNCVPHSLYVSLEEFEPVEYEVTDRRENFFEVDVVWRTFRVEEEMYYWDGDKLYPVGEPLVREP